MIVVVIVIVIVRPGNFNFSSQSMDAAIRDLPKTDDPWHSFLTTQELQDDCWAHKGQVQWLPGCS